MKTIIIFFIRLYKNFISQPLKMVFGGGCRFYPTCSDYAAKAIERYGVIHGGGLTLKRVSKCHPGRDFEFDLVPKV